MKSVDLNCDMGESYGDKLVGDDLVIMPFISSVNIACGFHGGDPNTIQQTIENALKHQLAVGAHPSFNDREGFGRRNMEISSEELCAILNYQISAIKGMVESLGGTLNHVKPHGALYNMMAGSVEYSLALVKVINQIDSGLKIFGLPNSMMEETIKQAGLIFVREAFSDRAYHLDGSLVSRKTEGAVLNDANIIATRVSKMVNEEKVYTLQNEELSLDFDTICIHGDTPNAVLIAEVIHQQLTEGGVQISSHG